MNPIHVARHHAVAKGLEAIVGLLVTGDSGYWKMASLCLGQARQGRLEIGTTVEDLQMRLSLSPIGKDGVVPSELIEPLFEMAEAIVFLMEDALDAERSRDVE